MITKINIDLPCKSCYFLVNTEIPITLNIAFKQHFTLEKPSRYQCFSTSITNGNTKLCFCNINFLMGHIELKISSSLNQTIKYVINNNILYICISEKLLSLLELCYFKTLSFTSIKVTNIYLINFEFKQILFRIATGDFFFFQVESCRCIFKKEFTLLSNFMIDNYVSPYYKIHKYKLPILQHILLEQLYEYLYIYYQIDNKDCFQFSNANLFHSLYHAKRLANISQEFINPDWNFNMTCILEIPNIFLLCDNQKWYLNRQIL